MFNKLSLKYFGAYFDYLEGLARIYYNLYRARKSIRTDNRQFHAENAEKTAMDLQTISSLSKRQKDKLSRLEEKASMIYESVYS